MSIKIVAADFSLGAARLEQLPPGEFPEIALVGRSNVGKSTFLNRITQRSKLARVSKTPGRTQQINIFTVQGLLGNSQRFKISLADLPGFGYAKLSKGKGIRLSKLLASYLENRRELQIVCILNDCRREARPEELRIRDLAFEQGKQVLIVGTKLDQVPRSKQKQTLSALASGYGLDPDDIVAVGQGPSNKEVTHGDFWHKILHILSVENNALLQ